MREAASLQAAGEAGAVESGTAVADGVLALAEVAPVGRPPEASEGVSHAGEECHGEPPCYLRESKFSRYCRRTAQPERSPAHSLSAAR